MGDERLPLNSNLTRFRRDTVNTASKRWPTPRHHSVTHHLLALRPSREGRRAKKLEMGVHGLAASMRPPALPCAGAGARVRVGRMRTWSNERPASGGTNREC